MATTDFTNGVSLSDAGWADDVDCSAYSVLTGVAGTNTITGTGPATYSYAATRPPIWLIPANTNSGATTINVTPSGGAALGAKNVFCNGSACTGGELRQGVPVALLYDGTQFNVSIATIVAATQAEQETGSIVTAAVTPGRQHFHPSAAKGWVLFDTTGVANAAYNVTSVSDHGAGSWTVNWATDFSGASYSAIVTAKATTGSSIYASEDNANRAAGTTGVFSAASTSGVLTDPNNISVVAFGDQ